MLAHHVQLVFSPTWKLLWSKYKLPAVPPLGIGKKAEA
jgi:hypothetical protein